MTMARAARRVYHDCSVRRGDMREILAVLRNRNMASLLTGRLISNSGDWIYSVAVSVAIYQYSRHQAYYIGLFWIIRLIPSLTFGPFAGVVATRLGYRTTMISTDVGRALLVALLAVLLRPDTWAAVFPIGFLIVALGRFFAPSSVGLIPSVVSSPDERIAANAAVMQVSSLAIVLGSAFGGLAIPLGFTTLLVLDAVSFLISAASLAVIRPRAAGTPSGKSAAATKDEEEEIGTGVLAGVRLLRGRPLLLFAVAVMILPEFASGAAVVWFIPMSEQVLHLGGNGVGYLYGALGIGELIGGFAAALIGTTVRLPLLLALSVGALGVVFGLATIPLLALFFILLAGLFEAVELTVYETLIQQAVPEQLIAHAFGTLDSFLTTIMLIGNLVSGFLLLVVGVGYALAGLGALILAGGAGGWWYLRAESRGKPRAATLAQVPAFSHVPPAMREWAVRRMIRAEYPAGATVIRQGAEGDMFYTIADGQAEAEVDGHVERTLQPGDFFGEIALLHRVPRTATVRAVTPLVVWGLSREDFDQLREQESTFRDSLLEIAASRLASQAGRTTILQPGGS